MYVLMQFSLFKFIRNKHLCCRDHHTQFVTNYPLILMLLLTFYYLLLLLLLILLHQCNVFAYEYIVKSRTNERSPLAF
jgi:hypothetical protein